MSHNEPMLSPWGNFTGTSGSVSLSANTPIPCVVTHLDAVRRPRDCSCTLKKTGDQQSSRLTCLEFCGKKRQTSFLSKSWKSAVNTYTSSCDILRYLKVGLKKTIIGKFVKQWQHSTLPQIALLQFSQTTRCAPKGGRCMALRNAGPTRLLFLFLFNSLGIWVPG